MLQRCTIAVRSWRNDCHKMVLMLCSAQKKPSYIGADTRSTGPVGALWCAQKSAIAF
jgi:hypothetical protein